MDKIILGLMLLFLSTCYKDSDTIIQETTLNETPELFINTKISGTIIDPEGKKTSNYNLIINGEKYPSNGVYFNLELNNVKQKGEQIVIEKDNKRIAIYSVVLFENDINRCILRQNLKNPLTKSFEENLIIDSDNYSLDFTNTKFKNQSNEVIEEAIRINLQPIQSKETVTHSAYGEFNELLAVKGNIGFSINFESNNDKLKVSNSFLLKLKTLSSSTNTLLYYNEGKNRWEKSSTISDEINNIKLTKSGYYLLANTLNGVLQKGKMLLNSTPVSYQNLDFSNSIYSKSFITTLNGNWVTILPKNTSLKLNYSNDCGDSIFLQDYSSNKHKEIKVNLKDVNNDFVKLDFIYLDCNGNKVNNPELQLGIKPNYFFDKYKIKTWLPANCDNSIITTSNGGKYKWSPGENSNIHVVLDCPNEELGISYMKIGTDVKIFHEFQYSIDNGKSVFSTKDNKIKIIIQGTDIRNYEENEINIFINDSNFGSSGYSIDCRESQIGCGINHCQIVRNEQEIGGQIQLELSGSLWMQTISPILAGYFSFESTIVCDK